MNTGSGINNTDINDTYTKVDLNLEPSTGKIRALKFNLSPSFSIDEIEIGSKAELTRCVAKALESILVNRDVESLEFREFLSFFNADFKTENFTETNRVEIEEVFKELIARVKTKAHFLQIPFWQLSLTDRYLRADMAMDQVASDLSPKNLADENNESPWKIISLDGDLWGVQRNDNHSSDSVEVLNNENNLAKIYQEELDLLRDKMIELLQIESLEFFVV